MHMDSREVICLCTWILERLYVYAHGFSRGYMFMHMTTREAICFCTLLLVRLYAFAHCFL